MRLAFDATALFGRTTGVGNFCREVLHGLAARDGVDVVAYAVTWRGRDRLAGMVPPGVRTASGVMAAQPLRQLWRRVDHPHIERWTGPVDVVHGPNFVVPPTRAGALATVHDLTSMRFPELVNADTRQYPALLRRALQRGADIHAVSRFVGDEIVERLNAPADRVHVVPNGFTPVTGGRAERGRASAGTDRYVLAIGTVEPRKDLPLLVGAFDDLAADDPDLRLVVAGPDGWGVDTYDSAVARAAHKSRIVRLGWVDDVLRADLLAGAAVFAYPSRYEGFGLPTLEAMSVGTPVVATRAGALPEVVGDGALLVPVGDKDALAGALASVLGDEDVRAGLVARGTVVTAIYSWERTVDGLLEVYARV